MAPVKRAAKAVARTRPRTSDERPGLVAELEAQWCALSGAMAWFQLLSTAERGLTLTDLQAVDVLERKGSASASELADACGLTKGAITGMLDRLERAGVARRARAEDDARRLEVRAVDERPCSDCRVPRAFRKIAASFSDDDLRLINRFLSQSADALRRDARSMRDAR